MLAVVAAVKYSILRQVIFNQVYILLKKLFYKVFLRLIFIVSAAYPISLMAETSTTYGRDSEVETSYKECKQMARTADAKITLAGQTIDYLKMHGGSNITNKIKEQREIISDEESKKKDCLDNIYKPKKSFFEWFSKLFN